MNLKRPESVFFVGLDVGQARDPSAMAVVEAAEMKGEWDAANGASRDGARSCGCGTWSGWRWGRRIRRWWSGCGGWMQRAG